MDALAVFLIVASAAILLLLGTMHLIYTFHGPKLLPRDPVLREHMQAVSPGITRQTTMWKAWVGFNASHSGGAMLFGLIYGYLALVQPNLLFESLVLMGSGLLYLSGLVFLGKRYWFSLPLRGVVLAFSSFITGWALHLA